MQLFRRKKAVYTTDLENLVFKPASSKEQAIELGTIEYRNLSADGRHGEYEDALKAASPQFNPAGKPIFCNFVEWRGCQGCKDAGQDIFANPLVKELAETYFVPVAFNTWDRAEDRYSQAFQNWSTCLKHS